MKPNSMCRLCGDRDETKNHINSECSKLAQREDKTRPEWMGDMNLFELFMKSKFHYSS